MRQEKTEAILLISDLADLEMIMKIASLLGINPGSTEPMLQAEIRLINNFCKR